MFPQKTFNSGENLLYKPKKLPQTKTEKTPKPNNRKRDSFHKGEMFIPI